MNMLTVSFRKLFCAAFIAASASSLYAESPSVPAYAPDATGSYQPTESNLQARAAFSERRFGIFLHWGIYSMFGQGEWYMTNAGINRDEYAKAAHGFFPSRFNAKEWVTAFKQAGAKYICFTTRHHDGFSMFATKQSDYNIVDGTPFRRDVLRELTDECRRQGLAVHFYYSHIDWTRDDYPAGRVGKNTGKDRSKADWPSYFKFMNAQLTELVKNYDPDAIWFDGMWDHDGDSKPFDWQLDEQYALLHSLKPSLLVGNNHHQKPIPGEDMQFFERDLPGENTAGMSGQSIGTLPLETCQTMNGMWGYKVADQNYKSTAELIRLLVQTSGKGANLLLNVGPQPDGTLPETALSRLAEMGKWLETNGETIYGTQAGGYIEGDTLTTTRKDNRLFIHVLSDKVTRIDMPLEGKVKRVIDFSQKSPLKYKFGKGRLTMDVAVPADVADYIIEVELKK